MSHKFLSTENRTIHHKTSIIWLIVTIQYTKHSLSTQISWHLSPPSSMYITPKKFVSYSIELKCNEIMVCLEAKSQWRMGFIRPSGSSWIEGNFLPSIQLSKLTFFLCNANQKNANRTLIRFGLDDLLCLD